MSAITVPPWTRGVCSTCGCDNEFMTRGEPRDVSEDDWECSNCVSYQRGYEVGLSPSFICPQCELHAWLRWPKESKGA